MKLLLSCIAAVLASVGTSQEMARENIATHLTSNGGDEAVVSDAIARTVAAGSTPNGGDGDIITLTGDANSGDSGSGKGKLNPDTKKQKMPAGIIALIFISGMALGGALSFVYFNYRIGQ